MKRIGCLIQKEVRSYFSSPIALLMLVVLISVFNIFFFTLIDHNREATLRDMFKLMEFMFVFIIPILTMKTFAQERQSGTIEFLLTSPVTKTTIVLGKYLGVFIYYSLILFIAVAYYALLEFFSAPDTGAALSGYLGLWLEGGLFIAIGILCSSWTRNQIVAAITSYAFLFMLYFSVTFQKHLSSPIKDIIVHVSVWSHSQNFISGIVMTQDIVYFLSGILFVLFLTRISLEKE